MVARDEMFKVTATRPKIGLSLRVRREGRLLEDFVVVRYCSRPGEEDITEGFLHDDEQW